MSTRDHTLICSFGSSGAGETGARVIVMSVRSSHQTAQPTFQSHKHNAETKIRTVNFRKIGVIF